MTSTLSLESLATFAVNDVDISIKALKSSNFVRFHQSETENRIETESPTIWMWKLLGYPGFLLCCTRLGSAFGTIIPCLTAWSVMRIAMLLTLSYVNGLKAVTEFWIWAARPQMYLSIFLATGVTIPGHRTDRSLKRLFSPGQGVGFYNANRLYMGVPPREGSMHERTGREFDLTVSGAVADLEDGFLLLKPACQFDDTSGSSEVVRLAIHEVFV
ncbi:hypothetical protein LXL04_038392 [Taraxacum kok-saghyz]